MTTPDDILESYPHASFRRMLEFWSAGFAAGGPPALGDLDLMDVYDIAPMMVVIDLEGELDGEHRYRWRLAGNALRHLVGVEMTAKYLDEVATPEMAAMSDKVYSDVLRSLEPHAWRHSVTIAKQDRSFVEYDRLLLPLLGKSGQAEHLIGVYDFEINEAL